ncbi:PREDICTED: DNA topoisomerase 6 subunit A-like [Fragaria vesca subsp. vesca]|uniref:DNA topoisomerase 6 subunit A-like n=1 Tax=Fragaria vesca subsp. vesca TaxID=101020 RepID=UPI0002C2E572|nr:PREDICTED: DNA topoisomerase 6 subunit A-like [Fragaria vesca subsp. vesca]
MADQKKTSEDDRRKRSRSCADEDDQAIRNDDRWLILERTVVLEIIQEYCTLNSKCMRSRSLSTNNKSKPPSSSELLDKLREEQRDIADNKLRFDKRTFQSQSRSNAAIKHLCCKLGADRESMNLRSDDVSLVIGPLKYTLEGVATEDCNWDAGLGEKSGRIVPSVKSISGMDGDDVMFVLVVESYCVYHELVQANFHKTYSCCLIMTGKGMADVKLRLFVKYVMEKLEVPVFYLSDSDPNGIEITTVYKYGSANMAYDAENVANPHIVWLGIWSTDLPEYEIPYWE